MPNNPAANTVVNTKRLTVTQKTPQSIHNSIFTAIYRRLFWSWPPSAFGPSGGSAAARGAAFVGSAEMVCPTTAAPRRLYCSRELRRDTRPHSKIPVGLLMGMFQRVLAEGANFCEVQLPRL